MKNRFYKKVKNEKIVDTRKYRYYLHETATAAYIERCPIKYIGTVACLNGRNWETVKIF